MTAFTFEEPLLRRLQSMGSVVQVLDPAGAVVGYFVPKIEPQEPQRVDPPYSEEEIQRRLSAGGGRTLDEIKRDWMH